MASVIPIKSRAPTVTTEGCGACLHSAGGPVCQSACDVSADHEPEVSGPTEAVQRLLSALDLALGPLRDGSVVSARSVIHSLHLLDGEAELTLAIAPHCGGALLADAAFDTMRRLLPDTDIYVRHAA